MHYELSYEDVIQDAIDRVSAWGDFETDEAFFAAVRDQTYLMCGDNYLPE